MSIAGFGLPDAGTIEIGGGDVTSDAPQTRNLGMVFQRYTLFPHMSVLENVALPLKMRRVGRAEREQRARRWRQCGLPRMGIVGRRSFPAGSSNAWRSRAPSSIARSCC